jgi:hypothetical protein
LSLSQLSAGPLTITFTIFLFAFGLGLVLLGDYVSFYLAMLNELGKELGEENLSRRAPDERANALRLVLAGKKALIVFDNLETLPEDERTRPVPFVAYRSSRSPPGSQHPP